nr:hypothetical protein [Nonomuraea polychroma]
MAKIVPTEVLVAELRHDLVPVRRVSKDRRADATASGTREQPGGRVGAGGVETPQHQLSDLCDDRDLSGSLALGVFVCETSGARRRLPAYRPRPGIRVDVADTNA